MLKILKKTMYTILIIIALILIGGGLFITLSPQFGGSQSKVDLQRYEQLGHYEKGKFVNLIPTTLDMSFGGIVKTLFKFIKGTPNSTPDFEIPVMHQDSVYVADYNGPTELIWFGHSAFLLQMDGQHILIDPMLGQSPSPVPLFGGKRYSKTLPMEIEKLPLIDAVIFSHDHYDHLDYGSIMKLKSKVKMFYVPLGLDAHLLSWGVEADKIKTFDWWDTAVQNGISLTFCPSRHFSGRGLGDRNATLWGSWVIAGSQHNIYFSGDSGYGPHFAEIGEKFGPFDFAMLECGQYNEDWKDIHMMPEQTAQAAVDVKTEIMMPIHWAAFSLALHSWTDPVERVTMKARELNMPIMVPKIGEIIELNNLPQVLEKWWAAP